MNETTSANKSDDNQGIYCPFENELRVPKFCKKEKCQLWILSSADNAYGCVFRFIYDIADELRNLKYGGFPGARQ